MGILKLTRHLKITLEMVLNLTKNVFCLGAKSTFYLVNGFKLDFLVCVSDLKVIVYSIKITSELFSKIN